MHRSYDPEAGGYGDDAIALMRIALKETGRAAVAREQLEYVRKTETAAWSVSDREETAKFLAAVSESASPASPGQGAVNTAAPPSAASGLVAAADLSGPDRERFDQASQALASGSVKNAYALAQPLFAAYPRSRGVQDLRCQLATVRWLGPDEVRAECAAYTSLMDGGAPGAHWPRSSTCWQLAVPGQGRTHRCAIDMTAASARSSTLPGWSLPARARLRREPRWPWAFFRIEGIDCRTCCWQASGSACLVRPPPTRGPSRPRISPPPESWASTGSSWPTRATARAPSPSSRPPRSSTHAPTTATRLGECEIEVGKLVSGSRAA